MAQATQRHRTRTAWLALLLLAAALAAGGWWRFGPASGTPSQERARATPPAAPVHTAIVETKSFPVVLNGLGTVQATNTVIVRSRVDGQIERVTFEEGQMVNEGELLVQIDPAPFQAALDQAIAKHGQDEASLTNAKQDLQRTSILSKQGNATQQLLDQRTAQVASLTAQVQADQAAIASAKVQLNYTTIKSPLSGRAGFRLVDPGNIVHANDQNGILTITQLQPISVIFTAPEQDLPAINEALKSGPLQVTAFSSDGHKPLADGTLKLIDNQVDVASGTIKLKATFDNKNGALWPGLSVSTRLLVKTINNVVVVPDSAVQRGPNGLFAYVVSADSKAQLRNLKVGRIEDGQALVEDGLAAGERIVTSGHYRVQAGAAVEIVDGQTQKTANKRADDKVD
jgi:membrane fusion protein, multidrug efflux system